MKSSAPTVFSHTLFISRRGPQAQGQLLAKSPSGRAKRLVVRAFALFQLNLTIAVQRRARSRAIIAAGGLRPGGPRRARGSSESIGKAQKRIKHAGTCARTSLIQSAFARFQLNLTIAVRSRAGSRAIIATGGRWPGVPRRAHGGTESIGKGQAQLKNDSNCARTSLIQSASADFGYQPWNSFLGGRAVVPGIRTVCQIHVERCNSRLWLSALEFIPGRPGGCSGHTHGVSDSCGKVQQRARPTGAPPRVPIRHQNQPWFGRSTC